MTLAALAWPLANSAGALAALAEAADLGPVPRIEPAAPARAAAGEGDALAGWIDAAAAWHDVEATPVALGFAELDHALARLGPALVRVGDGLLAVLGTRRGALVVIDRERGQVRLPVRELAAALRRATAGDGGAAIERELEAAGVAARRRARAARFLEAEQHHASVAATAWLLRRPMRRPTAEHLRDTRLGLRFAGLVALHLGQAAIFALSWWFLASALGAGRIDGRLTGWMLCLATLAVLRVVASFCEGLLCLDLGELLKRRLLAGALTRDRSDAARDGIGRALGYALESDVVESTGLAGALSIVPTLAQLAIAPVLLAAGAGGWLSLVALIAWLAISFRLLRTYVGHRRAWTEQRLALTQHLVENMIGHRTRLAQEDVGLRHRDEDQELTAYLGHGVAMDRSRTALQNLASRGWLVVGLLALAPAFVSGAWTTTGAVLAIGGLLFAAQAIDRLVAGLDDLVAAQLAWRAIQPLYRAAASPTELGAPQAIDLATSSEAGEILVEARELGFAYGERTRPVIDGLDLTIRAGDRILLVGSSGSGKSTLASMLAGQRTPDAGSLYLHGLDRASWGDHAWRRRIALAPQFHENHVISASFAFNLLFGRAWPPSSNDMQVARNVCRELGLWPLLEAMPGGMAQAVGQNGWQLSHGERSRLFIARALLQAPDVVILDESLAALDPDLVVQVAACIRRRARALIVVAHP